MGTLFFRAVATTKPVLRVESGCFYPASLAGGSGLGVTVKLWSHELYLVPGTMGVGKDAQPALVIQDFRPQALLAWLGSFVNVNSGNFLHYLATNNVRFDRLSTLANTSQFVPGTPVYVTTDPGVIQQLLDPFRGLFDAELQKLYDCTQGLLMKNR